MSPKFGKRVLIVKSKKSCLLSDIQQISCQFDFPLSMPQKRDAFDTHALELYGLMHLFSARHPI